MFKDVIRGSSYFDAHQHMSVKKINESIKICHDFIAA